MSALLIGTPKCGGQSTLCAVIILLPVLGLAVFWLLPTPVAIAVYAVVVIVAAWVLLSVKKSIGHLWNRTDKN